MKYFKYLAPLFAIPLLIGGCTSDLNPTPSGKTSGINMDIDVESIDVGTLHRDSLTGEIKNDAEKVYFDFYEVSDFHGAVNYDVEEKTIGLEKMANYFAKKRQENPGGTVVLSSGDMYQGSAESNLTKGYLVNYSMNIMGFEAMAMGNHEFDWGLDALKKTSSLKVDNYSIPYLGANIFVKNTNSQPDFLIPSTTITRGDYKIGVVGTLGDNADESIMKSLISTLEFRPELNIVKSETQKLKEQGCDIVVWLSHRSASDLKDLSGGLKEIGVDAVFGGHSHENSDYFAGEIPFVQTKNYGKGIAHVQLSVNKSTKTVEVVNHGVDVEPYQLQLDGHAEIKKVMDTYGAHIDPIKNTVIGKTDEELDISNTYSLTNLCVETMSEYAKEWAKGNGNVEIVAAFHNSNGGVRAPIAAGNITVGNVYKSFPFDNEIVIAKVDAPDLRNIFQRKASGFGMWTCDAITKKSDVVDGKEYYICTTDFVAGNYFNIAESDFTRTGYIVRDSIVEKIQKKRNIRASEYTRENNPQFARIS